VALQRYVAQNLRSKQILSSREQVRGKDLVLPKPSLTKIGVGIDTSFGIATRSHCSIIGNWHLSQYAKQQPTYGK